MALPLNKYIVDLKAQIYLFSKHYVIMIVIIVNNYYAVHNYVGSLITSWDVKSLNSILTMLGWY